MCLPNLISLEIKKMLSLLLVRLSANADFLITGDRDFTEVKSLENTLIISIPLFAELIIN